MVPTTRTEVFSKKSEWYWLQGLAHRWGLAEALANQEAVFAWRSAVGPQLSRWARPLYVARGVLHLSVASYVAASQLRLLEPKLVEALYKVAPDCGVRQLRLHVQPEPTPKEGPLNIEVTPADVQAAEGAVPVTVGSPLREKLVKAAARAYAQERAILHAGGHRCTACEVAFLGEGSLCPLCSLVGDKSGD